MVISWLHRYAVLLAVCTLFLVVAGASVTSKQAGLSVPDWPLSYGQVMPEMSGGVFYEHGHRMVASTVGLMTIVLAIWLWRRDDRRWMRILGLVAVAAVVVQGLLGGLTVLLMLPKAVSIAHACLAQLFFSLTVAIAVFTSPSWREGPLYVDDSGWPPLRVLAIVAALIVLTQIALGAGYRHSAFGIMPHVIGAMVVALVVLMAAMFALTQFPKHKPLRRVAHSLLGLVGVQVVVGIVTYAVRVAHLENPAPSPAVVLFTVIHVAMGALTMAAAVMFAVHVFRHVRPHVSAAPAPVRTA